MSVFEDIKTGLGQAIEQERANKVISERDKIVEDVLEKVKEKLDPTMSALFVISEILVDESKSHISSEKALNDIRKRLGGTISSRYRLERVLEEIKEGFLNL